MSHLTRIALSGAVVALLLPATVAAQSAAPTRDTAAAATQKVDSAAPAATVDLEVLTGFYEIVPGRGLTITLDKGTLFGAPSTGEKRKLNHQSGTAYAVEGTSMTLTFILGPDGRATDLIMQNNGQQRMLRKTS